MPVPLGWMPPARMQRIICHWTAGTYAASSLDKRHYHILIEGDGGMVRGNPSIVFNEPPVQPGYAAHTLNCNSGSIAVSLCCMANAIETPFDPGRYPMRRVQWDRLTEVVAALCRRYEIPVTPQTVLSHAEVQGNLGIRQRGKWNFKRLAFDGSIAGARPIGDWLRREVLAVLASGRMLIAPLPTAASDSRARPLGTVTVPDGDVLNMREAPGAEGDTIGVLTSGDKVEINRSVLHGGQEWLSVIAMDTRAWAWVHAAYVDRD